MKTRTLIAAALLLAAPGAAVRADDNVGEFGGFISNEETRFKDYVWDFVDELAKDDSGITDFDHTDSWINESFKRTRYEYSSCYPLVAGSIGGVDSVDIAYLAGHGSPSSINMSGESCGLVGASWGSSSTNGYGDLEHIVFHSCKVLQMDAEWRNRWGRTQPGESKPFSGLHHAFGFTTNHNNGIGAGAWASDEFAENLEDGDTFRTSWYEAVEDGYWLSPYAVIVEGDNKQAIFYVPPHENETMSSYRYKGSDGKWRATEPADYDSYYYGLSAYYRS